MSDSNQDTWFKLRLSGAMRAKLEKEATERGRTLTAEILDRLEASFSDTLGRLEKLEASVFDESGGIEQIEHTVNYLQSEIEELKMTINYLSRR